MCIHVAGWSSRWHHSGFVLFLRHTTALQFCHRCDIVRVVRFLNVRFNSGKHGFSWVYLEPQWQGSLSMGKGFLFLCCSRPYHRVDCDNAYLSSVPALSWYPWACWHNAYSVWVGVVSERKLLCAVFLVAALLASRWYSHGKQETDEEFDARWVTYFNKQDIDAWELRKGRIMGHLMLDVTPNSTAND